MDRERYDKIEKLARALGITNVLAVGSLVLLWIDAHRRKWKDEAGALHSQTAEEIAAAAGSEWIGDGDRLAAALVETGFMARSGDKFIIRDYFYWVPWLVHN